MNGGGRGRSWLGECCDMGGGEQLFQEEDSLFVWLEGDIIVEGFLKCGPWLPTKPRWVPLCAVCLKSAVLFSQFHPRITQLCPTLNNDDFFVHQNELLNLGQNVFLFPDAHSSRLFPGLSKKKCFLFLFLTHIFISDACFQFMNLLRKGLCLCITLFFCLAVSLVYTQSGSVSVCSSAKLF